MTAWLRGTLRSPAVAPLPRGAVVVKLGGSLLGRAGWPAAVNRLLADLGAVPLLVVGGGAVVDALRGFDAVAPQPAVVTHRLAIDGMRLTARFAAASLDVALVRSPADAHDAAVLDAADWLHASGEIDRLPVGWQVTSDSIAAAVARATSGRLLLVKSVPPPANMSLAGLARGGWLDDHFALAARDLGEITWAAPA